jgi:hypothetical protein
MVVYALVFRNERLRIIFSSVQTIMQGVLNDLERARLSRRRMIWLLPPPFPPGTQVRKLE